MTEILSVFWDRVSLHNNIPNSVSKQNRTCLFVVIFNFIFNSPDFVPGKDSYLIQIQVSGIDS